MVTPGRELDRAGPAIRRREWLTRLAGQANGPDGRYDGTGRTGAPQAVIGAIQATLRHNLRPAGAPVPEAPGKERRSKAGVVVTLP